MIPRIDKMTGSPGFARTDKLTTDEENAQGERERHFGTSHSLKFHLFEGSGGSRGHQGRAPLWVQYLLFSCSFWEIFGQVIGFCPTFGLATPLRLSVRFICRRTKVFVIIMIIWIYIERTDSSRQNTAANFF